ncbi:MAG TPA: pyridoxal phosphate-dependent aminotransferase [Acidimicrobiia bacterium]
MAISARARELQDMGRHVIAFAAGEPDFPTPEHITAAAARSCNDPANHHYTANAGLIELRRAIADYTNTYSGVPVDAAEVVVTNGAKQAVYQTFAALIDPGDEVLLPSPHWVTYPSGVELSGGVAVPIPTTMEEGFKVSVETLERYRTDRTKMLIFVSPSNPTGAVYTAEEARAIGEWARDAGIWVMADEIYQRLDYETSVSPSIVAETARFENWILVNGVAKSYAMTGWRVGWMVGPKDVIDAAARHQSHATSNVGNVAQHAALAALTGSQESVVKMRDAFNRRRKLMFEMVSALDGVRCLEPRGAFYVFPDVTDLLGDRWATSNDFATAAIEEAAVALVPGESFGAPGFVRLSYATSDADIEQGMSRIAALIRG